MASKLKSKFWHAMSIKFWGNLPSPIQRGVSRVYADIYNKSISKHIIKPYCKANYDDPDYLAQFKPASGADKYQNFQDFFTREYITPPTIKTEEAWPCEGLLCEHGKVKEMDLVNVKGEKRHLNTIFGTAKDEIPEDHYYSNIFLHNSNYHRIHAPVNSMITRIEKIAGDLVLLRPWAYKQPSVPALRNERVNVDLVTPSGEKWYMSIVGGPAVGTILLANGIKVGSNLEIGQEIATFLLGSTCCIVAPKPIKESVLGTQVTMGSPL